MKRYKLPENIKDRVKDLFKRTIAWSAEKGIIKKSNLEKQLIYYGAELGELCDAYLKGNKEEVIDGIGDSLVTLVNSAYFMAEKAKIGFDDFTDLFCDTLQPFFKGEQRHEYFTSVEESTFEEVLSFQLSIDPTHIGFIDWAIYNLISLEMKLTEEYNLDSFEFLGSLEMALKVIEARKGKMENGVFMKEN